MGAGIAEVCLRAGLDVVVVETGPAAAARARERVTASLGKALARGRLGEEEHGDALGRLTVAEMLDALADRELVVEAVVEDRATKLEVFAALAGIV